MTRFSKLLAIVTAVASLAFMGFAGVVTFGGPNWQGMAASAQGDDYVFSRSEGENPQWSAVRSVGEEAIGQASTSLAPVIVSVYDDKLKRQADEIQRLNARLPDLQNLLAQLQKTIEVDKAALAVKQAELEKYLSDTRAETAAIAKQVVEQTEAVQLVEDETERRREDVIRLRSQVEEARTDLFRLEQIEGQLRDLITQVNGSLEKADRRSDQLVEAGVQ